MPKSSISKAVPLDSGYDEWGHSFNFGQQGYSRLAWGEWPRPILVITYMIHGVKLPIILKNLPT